MPNEYDALFTSPGPRERVHSIASRLGLSPEIADDYLRLTKIESGHNLNVRDSPKGAKGFGQVMPDAPGSSTRTVGGKRYNLRNPDENIEAGLRYFSEGGPDPVARRLHYFGGPRARQTYERTGRIPQISDGLMTAEQYVRATGGQQQKQPQPASPYDALFDQSSEQIPPSETQEKQTRSNPPAPAKRSARPSAPISFSLSGSAFGKRAGDTERDAIRQGIAAAESAPPRQPPGMGNLKQLDEPEVRRIQRVQREVAAESPLSARLRPRATYGEVLRRVSAEKEVEARRERDEPRIAALTDEYRKQIREAAALTSSAMFSPQWTQEVVAKAAAGLAQLGAGVTRPVFTSTADSINIHAEALQRAAEAEGADRNRASKAVQNVVAGTISSLPEMVAMRAGVRAPVAFGAGGAARSYGRGERVEDVAKAGAHGAATGAIFEAPAALGMTRPVTRIATVGAGTGALELATGQPLGTAIEMGLTNAALAGVGEAGRPRRPVAAPERIVEVEGRSTIPGYEAETAARAQREAQVRPPLTPAEVERIQRGPQTETQAPQTPEAAERARTTTPETQSEILPPREPARFYHRDFGEVTASPNQSGIGKRRIRVVDESGTEHVIKRTTLTGRGNERAVPIREQMEGPPTESAEPARPVSPEPVSRTDTAAEIARATNFSGQRHNVTEYLTDSPLRDQVLKELPQGSVLAGPSPDAPEMQTGPIRLRAPSGEVWELDLAYNHRRDPAWKTIGTWQDGFAVRKTGEAAPAAPSPPEAPVVTRERAKLTQPPSVEPEIFLRDEAGQPLTVYHQTTREAEQAIRAAGFDLSKARARRSDEGVPDGVFFKPDKGSIFSDLSEKDSAQLAANLRIKSPLKVETREELTDWARKVDPEYAKLADKVQSYDRRRAYENQGKTSEYDDLIKDATAARARLTEVLRREGYDGVIVERDVGGPQVTKTYIALDPKQVKLLDPEPEPPPVRPATPTETTSARQDQLTQDRAELDLPELPAAERRSWQETLDRAKQRGTANASTLAEQVLNKPRSLNDVETGQLVLRAQEIKNQLTQLRQEIVSDPTPERIAQSDALQEEFNRLTQATKASGTEKGRTLAAQKLTINRDYDLTSLIQRATEAKGRKLTPEETQRYEQMAQRITELESQLSTASQRAVTDTIQREIDRATRQRQRTAARQQLDEEFAQLKQQFQQARAEARDIQASGLAGLDPEGKITPLIARMAKNRIQAGIRSAEALVTEIYETVKAHGWSRDDVAQVIRSTINQSDDVLSTWDKRRQAQLIKQQQEFTRRLEQRDFSKPAPRQPPIYNKETQRLQEQVQSLRNKFDLELQREQPGHWWRTLSALRKSWMLSGVSTQIKNIGGTGGYQVFEEIARLPAAIADAAAAPFTGRRTLTTSPTQMLDAVLHARKVGLPEAGQIMRRGATPEQLERHQFSEIDTGVKLLDYTSNLVFRFMSASDRVFYQYSYKRNLNDRAMAQAKNEGAGRQRARELAENPPEELDAAAKHDALVGTFNNSNRLSDAIKSARARLGPKANFAIDVVMPFDRTPTNVIARVLEASPVGLFQSGYRIAKGIIKKSMTPGEQRQFSLTFGRATAGTAIMGLGWFLVDKAFDVEDNGQVFLNVSGKRYNLNSISPVGNLLATGAKLRKDYEKGDILSAAKSISKTPLDQPLLRAGGEVAEFLRDPERTGAKTGARTASSFIPFGGATRDIAKALDPEERRFPDPKSFTQQVQQNLPVLRERLPISRSKVFSGQSRTSPATKEIQRLNMRLQGAMPGDDENPQQYTQRRAVMNPTIVKELERLVQSPAYQRLSDEDKKKQIRSLVQSVAAAFRPTGSTARRPARPARRDLRP